MDRQQFLAERRNGIGGSDAPVIAGVSPWKTPYQLYLEKRGEAEGQGDNPSMFWGRTLEPIVRQQYATETGRTVEVPSSILRHPRHEWMIASLDGIAHPPPIRHDEPSRVLEVKTSRMATGWGEPGSDDIPDHYMVQVQHYMSVTGLPEADIAVLIGGSDFRIYTVAEDVELIELLIEREAAFWEMVQEGRAPEVTTFADVKRRFGARSQARRIQATTECLEAIANLIDIAEMKRTEDEWKAVVMKALGDADTLVDGQVVLATWKADKPGKRFSADILKGKYPEIYQECMTDKEPSRRFLLKTK